MLRTTDITAPADFDVEQSGLAHPFEMRTYRVRMQGERLGDVGGGERLRRPGEFEVDRVACVVAECLEQVELRRCAGIAIHTRRLHGFGR